ncbi:hypothetical protein N0M98_18580 [Paenibacillus doosanensis]|uniref:hypothetical protein n=1 Tax=Paenibacillus doosanensis TaxID=1229154 RepID=UPI002180124E|nr:hypothetical protein [Paenibacillus doosanensis]MCS7462148.1 hypothetical protein [Paenibacillus doosanensis]
MRSVIYRLLCFALLIQPLAAGGLLLPNPAPAAAASVNDIETMLEKDFSVIAEGTSGAQMGFDYGSLPAGAEGTAVIETEPATGQRALHMSVKDAGKTPFLLSKTFGESRTGTITAEITFLQPGSKKQDQLLQLYNSGIGTSSKYLVIGGLDPNKGAVYWTDTAPTDLKIPYQVDQWHTMKLEVNTVNKRFSLWLDGVLIRTREKANLFSSTEADAFNFKKLVIGTPAGDGELYVHSVKVTHIPPKKPEPPQIAYWVGRNQSIAVWIYPDTAATKYAVKIKAKEEDPWYISSSYTGTPQSIPILASPSASNEWDYDLNKAVKITNGKKYYIGITAITRDEFNKVDIESDITEFEATPYAVTPVQTPDTSIIGTIEAYNNYSAHRWSLQSGLKEGDEVFADRTSPLKIDAAPAKYQSVDRIKMHADTMKYSDTSQIATFPVRDKANVYVAMDQRETPPDWLQPEQGWSDTGDTVKLSDTALSYTFKIYKKVYDANEEAVMGLNRYADYNSGKNAGYFVFAERIPTGLTIDPVKEYTNTAHYTISGSVTDNVYAASVSSSVYQSVYDAVGSVTLAVYHNKSLVYNSPLSGNRYELDLTLTPGENLVEVIASRSHSSFSDQATALIHYDRDTPELQIPAPPSVVREPVYNLEGTLSKAASLTVKLNGRVVADSVGQSVYGPFAYPLTLDEGSNIIEVSSVDLAGNEASVSYMIRYEFWAGLPQAFGLSGAPVSDNRFSDQMLARKQITNTTATVKHVTLWFVLYDDNRTMLDYSSLETELAPGETKTLHAGFSVPASFSGYVKAFVWDSMTGMKPLSDTLKLSGSTE